MSTATAPRLKERFKSEVSAHLVEKFGFKNRMQIPTLTRSEEHTSETPVTDQSRMPSSA